MNYIDNTPLFTAMPERQVYSSNAKVWIGLLAFGMAGTAILATIYVSKVNKEKKTLQASNNIAQDNPSSKRSQQINEMAQPSLNHTSTTMH